jgi:hypothetical protein
MQQLQVEDSSSEQGKHHPVSKRTAMLLAVLAGVAVLAAVTVLTTPGGYERLGTRLASLSSSAFGGRQNLSNSVVNCIVAPCPGDAAVYKPAAGEQVKAGENYLIKWAVSPSAGEESAVNNKVDSDRAVSIYLYHHPACLDTAPQCAVIDIAPVTIAESVEDKGEYNWMVSNDMPGVFYQETVRISVVKADGQTLNSGLFKVTKNGTMSVENFAVTSPAVGQNYQLGASLPIRWTVVPDRTEPPTLVRRVNLYLKSAASCPTNNCPVSSMTLVENTEHDGEYNWTVPANLAARFQGAVQIVVEVTTTRRTANSPTFTIGNTNNLSLAIATTDLPAGQFGQDYQTQLSAIGGQSPYQWSVNQTTSDWQSLTINAATGVLTGKARSAGPARLTVSVKDNSGASVSKQFTVNFNSTPTAQAHGAGTLVLGLDGIPTSVNLILDNNQRKGFASGEIFMSHGYKWQRIISGNSGDQALFTVNGFDFAPGTLVKVRNNPRSPVYLVYPNRVIRAFTDYDTFQAMGYRPSMVYEVLAGYLNGYSQGEHITRVEGHPTGTDIVDGSTIYRIDEQGRRRAYASVEVYNTWHTFDYDFSRVVPANQFDRALPTTAPMNPRF